MNVIRCIYVGLVFSYGSLLLPTSSMMGAKKILHTHYFGELQTRVGGKPYKVESIVIYPGEMQAVTVYEKPAKHEPPVLNDKEGTKEIPLLYSPKDRSAEITVKFEKGTVFSVPSPDVMWVSKNNKGRSKTFIEITIAEKGQEKSFLISDKFEFHLIDSSTAEPMKIPLRGIQKLSIDGVKYDDPKKEEGEND